MVSQKTWGSNKETSFVNYEQTFDALREGPGTAISYDMESVSDVVLELDMKFFREEEYELVTDIYTPVREFIRGWRNHL